MAISKKAAKMTAGKTNGTNREALLEMRRKILAELSSRSLPHASPTGDIGDVADQAVDEQDRGLSLLLTGREKEKLRAVQEALDKVDGGTYGVCEECRESIGPGRLKALPLAKLCVACQSTWEEEIESHAEEETDFDSADLDSERDLLKEEN